MKIAQRALAAALLCGGAVAFGAPSLRLHQPDGKVATVIDDQGAGGPLTQWIERRNPDGSVDLAFGRHGRATFSLADDILQPWSLGIDAQGRLILAGAAAGPGDRSAAVVSMFLPDGRRDLRWGTQGTSRIAPKGGRAEAVDALSMPGRELLLLGRTESAGAQRVVLWRLRPDGHLDDGFGRAGVLPLAPLDGAQPTSLRADEGGAVWIAAQRRREGALVLEVHRWQPDGEAVRLVARQAAPPDWRGPVTLERRDGRWHWYDARAEATTPLVLVDDVLTLDASAAQAATSPFADPGAALRPVPTPPSDRAIVPGRVWIGLAAVPAGLLLLAWRRRTVRPVPVEAHGAHAAMVDAALRDLASASPTPAEAPSSRAVRAAEAVRSEDAERRPRVQPDDLRRIKGIGAVLEARLHEAGIFTFGQIARWQPEDVAAIGARLSAFRGRIERDRWVAQANALARRAAAGDPPLRAAG